MSSVSRTQPNTKHFILSSVFIALMVISARIVIPIPVVPFTLQYLISSLIGFLQRPKQSIQTIMLYILLGLTGFPAFAAGGGLSYLAQPTFGYLIGFALGAYLTSSIAHNRSNPSLKRLLVASFSGLVVVYAVGMIYYYVVGNYLIGIPIGVKTLIWYCFLLAVPGDIVLCIISAKLAVRLLPVIRKQGV